MRRDVLSLTAAAMGMCAAADLEWFEPISPVPVGDRNLRRLTEHELAEWDTPQPGESRQVRRARERRLAKPPSPYAAYKGQGE